MVVSGSRGTGGVHFAGTPVTITGGNGMRLGLLLKEILKVNLSLEMYLRDSLWTCLKLAPG